MIKMASCAFRIAIEPDSFEDGSEAWHASCPALKGCHTWGHTYEDALANIREAIDLYVEDLLEAGEAIPRGQA
jgi:predicted RNase H-like HicB family nuclease